MKKISLLVIVLSFVVGQVTSDYSYTGAEATGTAGALAANPGGSWSLYHNPSGLADCQSMLLTVGNTNIFSQSFLQFANAGLIVPTNSFGSVGLSMQLFDVGYPKNNLSTETAIGFSHGFNLQKDKNSQINFGYALSYYEIEYGKTAGLSGDGSDGIEIGNQVAFGLDIGFQAVLRKKHRVGIFAKNINQPELNGLALPRRLDIGMAYTPYDGVVTSLVFEQLFGHPDSQLKGAIIYDLNNYIVLRVGAQTNPNRLGCGIGIQFESIQFDYSFLSHHVLPATHQMSLTYVVK
ncbi:MAG: hypothetical protein ISR90_05065 [Candidatus Marinimicrobia bacterium]|nr:hypothetical protein [Candidatus Neomarinimicrobiota bacterium]MBL7023406.1 hypothetical protein [Candidatus Neomarinimicrobiota bacterium]MBL7109787.1 hypothetical protein [Candidatus Neomarinimicrobiota bacterium]